MRGKGLAPTAKHASKGITPAYAGKSGLYGPECHNGRDHPRVCGEKEGTRFGGCMHRGSPPRMRGKGDVTISDKTVQGITPAYAGKSKIVQALVHPVEDHPRVCGEKAASKAIPSNGQGSPPRMRGKAIVPAVQRSGCGITPAYAGKRRRTLHG